MKKIISALIAIFCLVTVSMSAMAEGGIIQPRNLQCPECGRFSVVSVKQGEGPAQNRQEPCIHYTQGMDEVMDIYAYYIDICGSCVYESPRYGVDTGEDIRICHGW